MALKRELLEAAVTADPDPAAFESKEAAHATDKGFRGKMARKDVKAVIESLAAIGYKELNKSGAFVVPGFAKFVVVKKPATKERSGINPFTKEQMIFKAKPASKKVRVLPLKSLKALVN